MALRLRLITPTRRIVDTDVDEITAPGAVGEFGVLPEHVAFVGELTDGILTYVERGTRKRVVVFGGYATHTYEPAPVLPPTVMVHDFVKAQQFEAPTIDAYGVPHFSPQIAARKRLVERILVGGKDVTVVRGVPTPMPTYELVEPLLYGSGSWTVPQFTMHETLPAWQDLDLILRVVQARGPARIFDAPLYRFRDDDRNDRISRKRKAQVLEACRQVVAKYPDISPAARRALYWQVFGEHYGFPVDWRDVRCFVGLGATPRELARMLLTRWRRKKNSGSQP